jgi:hypothetical protein
MRVIRFFQRDGLEPAAGGRAADRTVRPHVASSAAVRRRDTREHGQPARRSRVDQPGIGHARRRRIVPEHPQDEIRANPAARGDSHVRPVARPRVFAGMGNQPCPHGVQVDVSHELEQVSVVLDQQGVIAPLEQVAVRAERPLEIPCVTRRDPLHRARERHVRYLHEQVQVVRHPAVGVQRRCVTPDGAGDDLIEPLAILGAREDRVLMIATQGDMVVSARHVHSRATRHRAPPSAPCMMGRAPAPRPPGFRAEQGEIRIDRRCLKCSCSGVRHRT